MKRKTNQDSIGLSDELRFYVVADGMGGHNGGDIASQMSVKLLPDFIKANQNKFQEKDELLAQAVAYVNDAIYSHGQENEDLEGMGTTISAVLFDDKELCVANVGDSRVYIIKEMKLFQMTRDNSLVQERLNAGFYDREGARNDPQKNVLIRTVGFEQGIKADIYKYKVCKNDLFLICSDGLHGKVADQDLMFILNKNIPDQRNISKDQLDHCVKELIQLANHNGGQDNISVIIALAK
jgi:protein phosphatase